MPPLKRLAAFLAMCLGLILWACHTEPEPGKTYLDVEVDAAWIGPDTVRVILLDQNGVVLDTLYKGIPASADVFKRLEVEGYKGETVRISLQRIRNGKVIYIETRVFNGLIGSVLDRIVVTIPEDSVPDTGTVNPAKAAFDIRPDRFTLYVGGESRLLNVLPETSWAGKPVQWASLQEEYAKVSSGVVSAVSPGEAAITAEAAGGNKDTSWVTVIRDVPELDVGAPDTAIKPNTTLAFKVRATQAYGTIASFAWDLDGDGRYDDSASGFPVGTTEFSTTPKTYASDADLVLHFYVRDGEGNVDTASKRLKVVSVVPVLGPVTGDSVVGIKDLASFSAEASVAAGTLSAYAWDYDDDGKTDDSAALSTATATIKGSRSYDAPGIYKARLKVYDAARTSVTGTFQVRVRLAAPVANAGKDTTVDAGATVNLKGTAFDSLGTIVSREWKIGASAFVPGDGDTSFSAPSAPGPLTCMFRVTDDDGLSDTDIVVVNVANKQAPTLAWTQADTTVSIKDDVAFKASAQARGGDLKSAAWDWNGDGTADSTVSLSGRTADLAAKRNYPAAGTFTVKLSVTDADNFTATEDMKVTVRTAKPVVNAGNDTTVDVGGTISLKGTATDSIGRIVSLEWSIGAAGYVAGDADTSFAAPAAAGSLTCRFRATDDDGQSSVDSLTVTVVLKLAPTITWTQADTTISIKDRVTFSLSTAARGADLKGYSWDWDNNGTVDSSVVLTGRAANINLFRVFPAAGTFTVKLVVADQDNLTSSAQKVVTVKTYAPYVTAGLDTSVMAGTTINLHGSERDTIGTIVLREWKIGAAAYRPVGKGDTTFIAPAAAAPLTCLYRVTDDDGNQVFDEVVVTVLPSNNANLSGLTVTTSAGAALALDSAVLATRLVYQAAPAENSIATVRIAPTAAHAGATVSVNGSVVAPGEFASMAVLVGSNPATIEVTAADGTTKQTYKVNAYRKAAAEMKFSWGKLVSTAASGTVDLESGYYNPWHTSKPGLTYTGTGRYAVDWYGLTAPGGRVGFSHVNSYEDYDSGFCKLEGPPVPANGTLVSARCYNKAGTLTNKWAQVFSGVPRAAETGANGYLRVDAPATAGTYEANPEYSFNSAYKPVYVTRNAAGDYTLTFKNLVASSSTRMGNLQVTAFGANTNRCNAFSYSASGTDLLARVHCYTAAGAAADVPFNASIMFPLAANGTPATPLNGYWSGPQDITESQTLPSGPLVYSSVPPTEVNVSYGAVGDYWVDFEDMETTTSPLGTSTISMAVATALNSQAVYCRVHHITLYINTCAANVKCYDNTGKPVNSRFNLWFMR